ncbi:MAG: GAF domain-containing protein [Chloroflexi bacterium]|nr:MAG: GAF domain-containing protein [Chloroflexota bacterium]
MTFGGLTLLWLMSILLALAGTSSAEIAGGWIPPFERVRAVISAGLLVWGFTPLLRKYPRIANTLLGVNTVFAFIFYFLSALLWQGSGFNLTSWDIFFAGWLFLVALFGAINCALKLDEERAYALMGFLALLVGAILHVFLGHLYTGPHIPGWVRLLEMVAYPLFAVAVYKGAIHRLSARTREFEQLSQASLHQVQGLAALFEASREITAALDISGVADAAARSVAMAVGADQCAIALPDDGDDLSQLRLVAIHNPSRKGRGESVSFPLNDQPAIRHALKRKTHILVDEYQDNRQLRMLFTLMGARDVGPLVIQPLLLEEKPLGVLILGNAESKRNFSATDLQVSKILADQVALAIEHARDYAAMSAKAQQLSWTLRNQEMETSKRLAAMEIELKKSREEVSLFAQRLYEYESAEKKKSLALKQAQEQVKKLEAALEEARRQAAQAEAKDQQIQTLTGQLQFFQQQQAELQAERKRLQQKIEQMEQELAETRQLQHSLQAANERARKLARALKKATRAASQPVPGGELESLSCGVILCDSDYTIQRVNAAAAAMLARSGHSLVGKKLPELGDTEKWQKLLQQLSSSNSRLGSTTLKLDDKILRVTVSPITGPNGAEQGGLVTILYDVTTEAENQQARDEFIASLSQELRTPMTSITGYTDLLLGESVGFIGEMQRKFLQRIKANIERMNNMLNDLIGVTAIDAGQLEIRPEPVDMSEVIEDTVINARARLEEKELTLQIDLPDNMPLAEVDREAARQILGNLLNNAIKASPTGSSIAIRADIYEEPDPVSDEEAPLHYLRLSVRDSGGGIAEKDQGRVFERFYRADRPLIEGLGETGVGLAIVKSLVEAHGGRVWVESEIGEGSTFHCLLPISTQYNDPWQEIDIPPLDLNSEAPE